MWKLLTKETRSLLLCFSSLNILLNFLFAVLCIRLFGVNKDLDSYYFVYSVVMFMSSSFGWSLSSVVVPSLVRKEISINDCLVGFVTLGIGVSLLVIFLLKVLQSLQIISQLDSLDGDFFIVIFLLQFLDLYSLAKNCIHQSQGHFNLICLSSTLGFAFSVLFILSFHDFSSVLLIFVAQILVRLTNIIVFSLCPYRQTDVNSPIDMKALFVKYIFLLGSSLVHRSSDMFEKFIVSFLGVGYVSVLSFSQRMISAGETVINSSISNPAVTKFSHEKNPDGDRSELKVRLFEIVLITSAGFIVFLLFGEFVLKIIVDDTKSVPNALDNIYMVTLLLFALIMLKPSNQLFNWFLISNGEEKSVASIDLNVFLVTILLKLILTYYLGLNGLIVVILFENGLKLVAKSSRKEKVLSRKICVK